ncbi:hypothetical protein Anapl_13410 [Anas platyrhynchos]|uniref:Uncharacterized protein n=1 Tax=Anas platyrhynchos TaxID=8839 RepID=R0LG26_ANAPL|nr:hypothetical protein Anapl_13410 [Anas platyrhynchos]
MIHCLTGHKGVCRQNRLAEVHRKEIEEQPSPEDVLRRKLDQKGVGGRILRSTGNEHKGTREDIPVPGGMKSQQELNSSRSVDPQAGYKAEAQEMNGSAADSMKWSYLPLNSQATDAGAVPETLQCSRHSFLTEDPFCESDDFQASNIIDGIDRGSSHYVAALCHSNGHRDPCRETGSTSAAASGSQAWDSSHC